MSASSTKSRLHLNSFEIKIIALIFMTFDHFGAYQTFTTNLSINDFFRIVGRIAAPLFLFVVVESLHYTHNKVIYFARHCMVLHQGQKNKLHYICSIGTTMLFCS